MGAAIGMALGLGLNALGGYAAKKAEEKQQAHNTTLNFLMDAYKNNSEGLAKFAATPEGKKTIKATFGDQADMFVGLTNATNQANQQFNQQYAAATGGGGQPQGAPGGGVQPAMAASGGQSQQASPEEHLAELRSGLDRLNRMLPQVQNSPRHLKIVEDSIAEHEKEIASLQHEQDFQQAQAGIQAQRDATNALRQQGLQLSAQLHQDTLALQAQNAQFMHEMASMHEEDTRSAHFNSATQNLESQTQKIAQMLTSANPADKKTVQQLLQQRNAQAKMLKQQADKYGLDYDADQFKPLTINEIPGWWQQHTAGMVGSSTPVLGEEKPTTPSTTSGSEQPPEGATAAIKDPSGKVAGYKMKDGSIRWNGGKPPA